MTSTTSFAHQPEVARNLLLGLLAWQLGFVDREKLLDDFATWLRDRQQSFEQLLLNEPAISAEQKDLLIGLMAKHLELHGNSVQKSLQSLSSLGTLGEDLAQLGQGELQATLDFVGDNRKPSAGDATQSLATNPTSSPSAADSVTRPGKIRYRIVRSHAKGGLGEVFIAFDSELNREVAVKEIQKKFADNGESRSRFRMEAEVTGKLEHPGIVPVYGLGQYQDGRPFYAMRFIKGDSLQQAIEKFHQKFPTGKRSASQISEESLDLRKLLRRFIDVCNAMAYAHSRGVLHRDLKPGNIILGKYGETLVVDWGLAKLKGEGAVTSGEDASSDILHLSGESSSSPTMVGSAIGTPAFMSPEQAIGAIDQLGPATDIYSLGATLFHLLAGRPPFREQSAMEVIAKVQKGEFAGPRHYRPEVPPALEAICLKAMAFDPANRYASPLALSEDLERWLGDEPVQAKRDSWLETTSRFLRRHRAWAISGMLALFLVAVSASLAAFFINGARNTAVTAEKEQNRLRKVADQRTLDAQNAEAEQTRLRKVADERTTETRLSNYITNIRLANVSWQGNDMRAVEDALLQCTPVPGERDLRGWEWNYLQNLPNNNLWTQTRNGNFGCTASIQRDGRRAIIGTSAGAEIIDTITGKLVRKIVGHKTKDSYLYVALSPDGKVAATVASPDPLRIWDVESGKLLREIPLHEEPVSKLLFSPDGKQIASGSFRHVVSLWDVETGERKLQLNGHQGIIRGLAFNHAGDRLASGDDANAAKVWELETGREISSFRSSGRDMVGGVRATFFGVAFSPNDLQLATGCSNGSLEIFDLSSPRSLVMWQGHSDHITGIAYLPQTNAYGHYLASCSLDQTVSVWRLHDHEVQTVLRGHPAAILDMAVSQDGRRIVTVDRDATSKIWDSGFGNDSYLRPANQILNALAISGNGERIATAGNGSYLLTLDVRHRNAVSLIRPMRSFGILYTLQLSADGKRLLSWGTDHPPSIWDVESGQFLQRFIQADVRGGSALSPDGLQALIQSPQEAAIYEIATGKKLVTLEQQGFIARISFSPDGKTLAGITEQGIGIWNAESGKRRQFIDHPEAGVSAIATDYTHKRIACGYKSRSIYLFDMETGEQIASPLGHLKEVTSLAFHPSGTRLASSSLDHTIRIWELPTGQLLCTLREHRAWVTGLAFSADGSELMSTGYDNSIRWWNGRSESEHAAAKYKDTAYTAIEYWRRQMKSVEELPTLVANDPLLSPESRDYALSILRELPPKDFRIDWEKGP